MAPYDLSALSGTLSYALVFGLIGFAFGATLEVAGFGNTRKLAAQFYLTELTVLKVMFTAIIVAAVLLAGASALGLLDLSRVWVNPTYLWPGIVGGLIMGVGFVIGGFCPGTSLVAAATLKVDGIFFLLGGLVGAFAFGESVARFQSFFLSSAMGRFTLPEWLNLPMGVVVLLIALMALAMFWAGEVAERVFGGREPFSLALLRPRSRVKLAAAGVLIAACLLLVALGQPTDPELWARVPPEVRQQVEQRELFVDPAEVVALRGDPAVQVTILDVREEQEFNLFHVGEAQPWPTTERARAQLIRTLLDRPAHAVTFLAGWGEQTALARWQELKGRGVQNLYVIEGGLNRWLERYPAPRCVAEPRTDRSPTEPDERRWRFAYATGDHLPSAWPERPYSHRFQLPCGTAHAASHDPAAAAYAPYPKAPWPTPSFTKKVQLRIRRVVKGGCG